MSSYFHRYLPGDQVTVKIEGSERSGYILAYFFDDFFDKSVVRADSISYAVLFPELGYFSLIRKNTLEDLVISHQRLYTDRLPSSILCSECKVGKLLPSQCEECKINSKPSKYFYLGDKVSVKSQGISSTVHRILDKICAVSIIFDSPTKIDMGFYSNTEADFIRRIWDADQEEYRTGRYYLHELVIDEIVYIIDHIDGRLVDEYNQPGLCYYGKTVKGMDPGRYNSRPGSRLDIFERTNLYHRRGFTLPPGYCICDSCVFDCIGCEIKKLIKI